MTTGSILFPVRFRLYIHYGTSHSETGKQAIKCWITRTTDGNCCDWCTKIAGRYLYGFEPHSVYVRHDNCGCTTVYENGRQRQDVWSKKKWEVPEANAGASKPTILTPAQGRALQAKHKPTVLTKGSRSGIIKSLDIDDFELVATAHEIKPELTDVITSTIKSFEAKGGMYIADVHFCDFIDSKTKKPALFQIIIGDSGLTELNVNSRILSGISLEEINQKIKDTRSNLPQNLTEAVVHECGHAKLIYGKRAKDVEELYTELRDKGIEGISNLAARDGAECIAEIEVLLFRGEAIPDAACKLYYEYIKEAKNDLY